MKVGLIYFHYLCLIKLSICFDVIWISGILAM